MLAQARYGRRGGGRRGAGLSLLEILLAIGILVFGIYAVIRIFPPGLDIIQEGSRRTLATRVAESLAEEAQGGRLALPEGIAGDPLVSPRQVEAFLRGQRRIVNETVVLPAPVAAAGGDYIPYLLEQGPVDPADPVEVVSALYRRVALGELSNDGIDRGRYAVSNPTGELAFDIVPYDRLMALSYVWIDSGGAPHAALENLQVPAGAQVVEVAAAGQILFEGLIDNSESLYRQYLLEDLVDDAGAPGEPGAYLLSPHLGVLYGHPADAGQEIRISYTTRDWQVVREGAVVVNRNGRVELRFEFLADPRDPDDPARPPLPVRVVDRATGRELIPSAIDHRSGVLFGLPLGREIRVHYQTLDDWGVQWIPAARLYQHAADPLDPPEEAFRRYALALNPATGAGALGFAPSQGGKAVRVDYLAWDAAAGRATPVTGELHSIPFGPPPDAGLDPRLRWAVLAHPLMHTNGEPHQLSVRGASLKLRVLWRDNDGDLEHLDVDTYVGR